MAPQMSKPEISPSVTPTLTWGGVSCKTDEMSFATATFIGYKKLPLAPKTTHYSKSLHGTELQVEHPSSENLKSKMLQHLRIFEQ